MSEDYQKMRMLDRSQDVSQNLSDMDQNDPFFMYQNEKYRAYTMTPADNDCHQSYQMRDIVDNEIEEIEEKVHDYVCLGVISQILLIFHFTVFTYFMLGLVFAVHQTQNYLIIICGLIWNFISMNIWWRSFKAKENMDRQAIRIAIYLIYVYWAIILLTLILFIFDVKEPYVVVCKISVGWIYQGVKDDGVFWVCYVFLYLIEVVIPYFQIKSLAEIIKLLRVRAIKQKEKVSARQTERTTQHQQA